MGATGPQLSLLQQTAAQRLYRCYVAPKRPSTRDTLAKNLRTLMTIRDWTQVQLSEKSGVSQTMISSILRANAGCSVETADALAHAFGLNGWHLLMAGLTEDLLKSKAVQKLLDSYVNASPEGQALIDAMATRESRLNKPVGP
jgi:transcriptional regulator with XRE-family HTH domain